MSLTALDCYAPLLSSRVREALKNVFLGIFPKPVDPAHLHGISSQNESSVETWQTWQVKQTLQLQLEFMNLKRAKLEYFVSKDIIGYRFGEVRLGHNGYM